MPETRTGAGILCSDMTDGTQLLEAANDLDADPRAQLPLAVDLDGTLLRTDTLFEAIAEQMRTRLLWTLAQMAALPFGIARAKAKLQRSVELDVETLPVNEDVLAYCTEAREAGREVWLVTAADQEAADRVAARFDCLHGAIGSDGRKNNKGSTKALTLQARFPDGFEYIGDSPADRKVWRHAHAASHVGGGAALKQAIARSGTPVHRSFESGMGGFKAWRKALRVHQWAKNGLIYTAPALSMQLGDPLTLLNCTLAVLLLSVMASGTYILNDLLDLKADRRHASKRNRSFASGRLKLWQGFAAAPVMILGALGAGFLLSPAFAVTMLVYLAVTLSYSLFLKRAPLLDVMILGFLYTLRIIMGAVIIGQLPTSWFVVFSMFLFVSLSLAKRHTEILRKISAGGGDRIMNRGYRASDAPLTLTLGIACATSCPVLLVLYLLDTAPIFRLYNNPEALWSTPVVLSLWLMRVWLLANRGELDDDPVVFALKDNLSIALGVVVVISFALAALGPTDLLPFYGK